MSAERGDIPKFGMNVTVVNSEKMRNGILQDESQDEMLISSTTLSDVVFSSEQTYLFPAVVGLGFNMVSIIALSADEKKKLYQGYFVPTRKGNLRVALEREGITRDADHRATRIVDGKVTYLGTAPDLEISIMMDLGRSLVPASVRRFETPNQGLTVWLGANQALEPILVNNLEEFSHRMDHCALAYGCVLRALVAEAGARLDLGLIDLGSAVKSE